MKKFVSRNLNDNKIIIKEIFKLFPKIKIFLLTGSLGSGKTTFIKQIAKHLKIKENLTSPTFILWQRYEFTYKKKKYFLNHIDLYRISTKDILKINFQKEISKKDNLFFIEWGEKLKNYLKNKKYRQIIIKKNGRQRIFLIK